MIDPFGKDFKDVTVDDLASLCEFSEGWYCDYKLKLDKPRDIAKHLGSFANQYGGWLIFGVKEKDRIPERFPGISPKECNELLIKLREASSQHLQPEVYFETGLVHGPNEDLGLSADRSILLVRIPESRTPPHIHSSGRVYKRVADQSSPKEITDRSAFDLLVKKTEAFESDLKLSLRTYAAPLGGEETPLITIFLRNNHFSYKVPKVLSFEDFVAGTKGCSSGLYSLDMHTFHAMPYGFTARYTRDNELRYTNVRLDWQHTTNSQIKIPLTAQDVSSIDSYFFKFSHFDEFHEELVKQKTLGARIIDLTYFFYVFASLFRQYLALLEKSGIERDLYVGFRLENFEGVIPFVNDENYIQQIREYGFPVTDFTAMEFPKGLNILDFTHLPDEPINTYLEGLPGSPENAGQLAVACSPVFFAVLNFLGVLNDVGDLAKLTSLFSLSSRDDS